MRERVITVLVFGALLAGAGWAASRLRVETDITHFLPDAADPQLSEIAREVTGSELNRTITLAIAAPNEDVAAQAARELSLALAERDDVAWVRASADESLQRSFYELYFPRRLDFVADDPAGIGATLTDDALRARARSLKDRLALPTSPFTREIAAADPQLFFLDELDRLRESLAFGLRVHDGIFVSEDGRHGIVLLASRASAFDIDASRRLLLAIRAAFAEVDRAHDGALSLEMSGIHRFAVHGEESTRTDVTRVSMAGTLGVLLFLLLVFWSPRYLIVGQVPILAGIAAALITAVLVFGSIHGLTLAFGATLIGVAIDYVAHYLNHHVLAPDPGGPAATMKRIWPGLFLGGATTVAGLAGLAWTSTPAIREMAVLTSVGVAVALLATRFLMPPWLPHDPRPTRVHRALERTAGRFLDAVGTHRRALLVIPAIGVALVAGGLARLHFEDDVRALGALDPGLVAEDERVRELVARVDTGRFVVATGADVEEALARNDHVHAVLEAARGEGLVERQRSLHALLWSESLQRANHEAVVSSPDLFARTISAYEAEGFVGDAFAPFEDSLDAPFSPLRYEDLEGTPLAALAAPFVLETEHGVAILTFLRGVSDPDALAARLGALDGVVWFDQGAFMADAYRAFRTRTTELVVIGLLFVFALVFARYRNIRSSLAAFLPAVLAGAASLGAVSLLGYPITMIHVVTLLLVLSMGVDYGVFMVESDAHEEGPAPTVVSLVVACISTVLSFGTLALSDQVVLRAMGLTTAIGVTLSLLFAPAAWLIMKKRKSD